MGEYWNSDIVRGITRAFFNEVAVMEYRMISRDGDSWVRIEL